MFLNTTLMQVRKLSTLKQEGYFHNQVEWYREGPQLSSPRKLGSFLFYLKSCYLDDRIGATAGRLNDAEKIWGPFRRQRRSFFYKKREVRRGLTVFSTARY